jgi:hypothetical protein
MKKLLFILFTILSVNVNAQMISVTGGNLNLHGNNKGYIEIEAMQDITKNIATHISYTKTIGGYDIAMVGSRVSTLKQRLGLMLSACYMVNHKTMGMWGIDVRPIKSNPISVVYSQSTDNELKTIGLKFPIFNNHKSKENKH